MSIAVLIPIITRKLVIWWFGINEVIEQQKEMNALLKRYLEAQGATIERVPPPQTNQTQVVQQRTKSPYSLSNQ